MIFQEDAAVGQTCNSANGPEASVVIALGLVGTMALLKPRLGQPARQLETASRSLLGAASDAIIWPGRIL